MDEDAKGRVAKLGFAGLFTAYGIALLGSLFVINDAVGQITEPSDWTVAIVTVFLLGCGTLGYVGMDAHLSRGGKMASIPVPRGYVLGPVALVFYLLVFVLVAGQSWPGIVNLVAFVQATAFGLVLGVFSRPLVPQIPEELPTERRDRYLEHHLYNWWRSAQVAASFLVAFGVGITAASILQMTQSSTQYSLGDLALLSIVTGVSGVALGLYTLAKLYSVGQRFREELVAYDDTVRRWGS